MIPSTALVALAEMLLERTKQPEALARFFQVLRQIPEHTRALGV